MALSAEFRPFNPQPIRMFESEAVDFGRRDPAGLNVLNELLKQ